MSNYFATGKYANGLCDRCGFEYKLNTLKELIAKDSPTNLFVCRECWEADHPQNHLGEARIYDPQALRNARPDPAREASRVLVDTDNNEITPEALDELIKGL